MNCAKHIVKLLSSSILIRARDFGCGVAGYFLHKKKFISVNKNLKMSDSAVATSASPVAAPPAPVEKKVTAKKATGSAATKAKKTTAPPSHPPTQQMVDASIKNLKERGGSSLLAIKKYITATYKCDAQKLAPFIKKYLKSAVANGKLIQTKGKGASGSFKLSASAKKEPKPKPSSVEKKTKTKKVSTKKTGATTKKAAGAADKKP
ncbi:uncharacterized protein Dana_GF28027, partial [Drosophila ananassae]